MDAESRYIERRRFRRVPVAVDVVIGSITHRTTNLSAGGFSLGTGRFVAGARMLATLKVSCDGNALEFPVWVRVVFVEPRLGVTGFAFLELAPDQRAMIETVVEAAAVAATD